MIVLHEGLANARLGERVLPVGLHEEAARVAKDAGLDQQDSGKGSFDNLQICGSDCRTSCGYGHSTCSGRVTSAEISSEFDRSS